MTPSRPVRRVLIGVGSTLAVLALLASTVRDDAVLWWEINGGTPVELTADGTGTILDLSLRLERMHAAESLVGPYGDEYEPPPGWTLWLLEMDVVAVAAKEENRISALAVTVAGDDGKTYTSSRRIPSALEPAAGWFGASFTSALDGPGTAQDAFLLPDGVAPVRVEARVDDYSVTTSSFFRFDVPAA